MSNIHPFELYRLYLSIKSHYTRKSYNHYEHISKLKIKYDNFYKIPQHNVFIKLSNRWSKEFAEQLLISNLLKNPNMNIHYLEYSDAIHNKNEWLYRLNNVDKIFKKDIIKIFEHNNIDNFEELSDKILNPPKIEIKKATKISDISKKPDKKINTSFYDMIIKVKPETLMLLNHLYIKKYNINPLLLWVKNGLEPKIDFLKIYKYENFLLVDDILSMNDVINNMIDLI